MQPITFACGGLFVPPMPPPNPLQIFSSNLVAWYTADQGVTLSGSNVTAWADQSGNAHTLTPVNTSPVFSSTGFNSLSGITYTTNQDLTSAAFNISVNTAALFMAFNTATIGGSLRYAAYYTGTDFSGANNLLMDDGSTGFECWNNSASFTASISASTNYRAAMVYNGPTTTGTAYINNVAGTPNSAMTNNTIGSAANVLTIGKTGSADTAGFTIAEFVMVNVVPTSLQLSNMDAYLKNHWGL